MGLRSSSPTPPRPRLATLAALAALTFGCAEAEDSVPGFAAPAGGPDGAAAEVEAQDAGGEGCTSDAACDDDLPCSVDTCDAGGVCRHSGATGPSCDDGDPCTEGDVCKAGVCEAGAAKVCDDANPCTLDGCDAKTGACTAAPQAAKCDDGNPCTKADQCEGLVCKGLLFACDDADPCTDDGCDPKGGVCTHTPNAKPCTDGNACTEADTCDGGACGGKVVSCDDDDPCTNDLCAPDKGCSNVHNAMSCDDGDACTQGDVCEGGVCAGVPQPAGACDDNNPCTADGCKAAKGCVHAPVSGACDDGDPCTKGDACEGGKCAPGAGSCQCKVDADCAALVGADLCLGARVCDAATSTCKLKPGTAVKCAPDTTGCGVNACDPKTGKCVASTAADGTACDADGSLCTLKDACSGGACVAGKALSCDDGNPCTQDVCKPKVGCVHTATGAPCDADGDACTVGDVCAPDVCKPGPKKGCSDGNPCTTDGCDPKTGACVHDAKANEGAPCDADFSACTVSDACVGGVCVKGKALSCDDKNPCTTDSCHPIDGCQHTVNAMPCQDGNGCTVGDTCKEGKCASGATKACVDGDKCTIDGCDPATGKCVYVAIGGCSSKCVKVKDCDDKNPCTDDLCDNGVCASKANSAPCDDGDLCTKGEKCAAGVCAGGAEKDCGDGNACTVDACDAKAGCKHAPGGGPCEGDGDFCTVEACSGGACGGSKPRSCSDGQVCTADACDPKASVCTHEGKTLEGDPCDADGSVCTVGDKCQGGVCVKGAALPCDDAKACTADACDPAKGCVHTLKGGPCEDGDKCTLGDVCDGGACKAGGPKGCDDGDKCTADTCDPKTGQCAHAPVVGCGDNCAAASDCADGNGCTADACKNGLCVHVAHTKPCADGDKCFVSGKCAGGKCAGGAKVDCDDGSKCTDDTCDPKTGQCVFTSNTVPCDDGDLCTIGDACKLGKCGAGKPKACDDANPCTDDACNGKTGACAHSPNTLPCDDGDACTAGEACKGGKCVVGHKGVLALTVGAGEGYVDGPAGKAKLKYPSSVDMGPDGALYVADLVNNRIRKVTLGGQVSTFAGSGAAGFADGAADKASFKYPSDAVWAPDGYLYVADRQNHALRRVSAAGVVGTWAGDGKPGDVDGKLFKARFFEPSGLAADGAAVYVSERGNHKIRMVTLDGIVITLAGTGKAGLKDGPGAQAMFNQPAGLDVGANGTVWVADMSNHRVRRISAGGFVVTIAGDKAGYGDGQGLGASFYFPMDVRFVPGGDLVVADRQNHMLRVMTPLAEVTTLAGSGSIGALDEPFSVVGDGLGYVWAVSNKNHRLLRFRLPVTVCEDGKTCTADACDAAKGVCTFKTLADGTSCGPGCIEKQFCKGGKCVFGAPKNCNDYDACTNDYCVKAFCKHVPIPGCK